MPFEIEPAEFTYFFDCGIIVRGLLAAWRATGEQEFLDIAVATGDSMLRDFASEPRRFPSDSRAARKAAPLERDALRWSRTATCYQLKSAMAWWDLFEATGSRASPIPTSACSKPRCAPGRISFRAIRTATK